MSNARTMRDVAGKEEVLDGKLKCSNGRHHARMGRREGASRLLVKIFQGVADHEDHGALR